MDYKDYTVEDFVLEKRFRRWILNPRKEDNLFWEDYVRKHPDQLAIIEQAKKVVVGLPKVENLLEKKEKELLWATINRKIEEADHKSTKVDKIVIPMHSDSIIKRAAYSNNNKKKYTGLRKWPVAASVFLFLSLSFWMVNSTILAPVEQEVQVEKVIKQNPWGQKTTVYMSDGTEAILNSGSRLIYNKDFERDRREVLLEGEAFFKVAKDVHRPFRVTTGSVVTEALGTSFNVNAYSENEISIALVTGKVLVSHEDNRNSGTQKVTLLPGEQAEYLAESDKIFKKQFNINEICAWKDGVIYFKDANASDVFSYLEKWYGVKIIEDNEPLEKWDYTGEFDNLDLYNVLNSIGFAMNFEFTKDDKTYRIHYLNDRL